jgi:hypothetical protein
MWSPHSESQKSQWIMGLLIGLAVVNCGLLFYRECIDLRHYFKVKESPYFEKKAALRAFNSILHKEASPLLIKDGIAEALVEQNYSQMEFVGDEEIQLVKTDPVKMQCRIIVKDKVGQRYWLVKVDESKDFLAIYKVTGIYENAPEDPKEKWQ